MRHSFPDPLGPVSGIERPAILAIFTAEPKRQQDAAPVARDVTAGRSPRSVSGISLRRQMAPRPGIPVATTTCYFDVTWISWVVGASRR